MRNPCSIVVPTWNARDLVDRCLTSLSAAVVPGYDEIIVVDDGSTDGTGELIRKVHGSVRLETMRTNSGFGAAANRGVSCSRTDVVVLLNNDITVDPDFLEPLLEHFSDPTLFAVNSQVFQSDGSTPGGGLVRGTFHCGLLRLRWAEDIRYRERVALTLYANGAAVALDKAKFDSLGGFDVLYSPFYSEDLDLSYRSYQRGWHVLYEPASKVRHDHSVTISGNHAPGYISYISKRNRILFMWRNVRSLWILASSVAWMILRLLASMITLDLIFVRAFFGAVIRLPQIVKRRRADQRPYKQDKVILIETSRWYADQPTR